MSGKKTEEKGISVCIICIMDSDAKTVFFRLGMKMFLLTLFY